MSYERGIKYYVKYNNNVLLFHEEIGCVFYVKSTHTQNTHNMFRIGIILISDSGEYRTYGRTHSKRSRDFSS